MKTLMWIPVYDGRGLANPFLSWRADRFLKAHGGIGHIVADTPGPWPSMASTKPAQGTGWHFTGAVSPPKKAEPGPIFVESTVPTGAGHPALSVLDKAKSVGKVEHLILVRPSGLSLDRITTVIATLKDSWDVLIWLDRTSFGWDALSYLCGWDEALMPWGVAAAELHRLNALAEVLGRSLEMADFSGRPGHPIPVLPQFDDDKGPVRALKSLPIWSHSR
jgi:hypothetical protein